ncbi:hypothetical protein [uncultured Aquimarina sp.]|nr:hypothetical protein [uncultured Aquimarina sp.]
MHRSAVCFEYSGKLYYPSAEYNHRLSLAIPGGYRSSPRTILLAQRADGR